MNEEKESQIEKREKNKLKAKNEQQIEKIRKTKLKK